MAYDFELFEKGLRVQKGPQVTIQRAGNIGFNEASFRALGEPNSIELMYDKKQRVIGFRKAAEDSLYGCATRPSGPGRARSAVVSAKMFLMHFEIPFEVPLRYEAELVDGILIVDLKKPGQEAMSNRTRGELIRKQAVEDLKKLRDEMGNGDDGANSLAEDPAS